MFLRILCFKCSYSNELSSKGLIELIHEEKTMTILFWNRVSTDNTLLNISVLPLNRDSQGPQMKASPLSTRVT